MNKLQASAMAFLLYSFSFVLLVIGALVGIQQLPNVSQTPVFIFGAINIVSVIYLFRSTNE